MRELGEEGQTPGTRDLRIRGFAACARPGGESGPPCVCPPGESVKSSLSHAPMRACLFTPHGSGTGLARARHHRALRLPDFGDQLWPALEPWLVSHPPVAGERLGPRRIRIGARAAKHPVGARPAAWPGMLADRFGVVRVSCAGGIFYALGLSLMAMQQPADARRLGRRSYRLRLRGMLFRHCAFGFRQALAPRWRSLAFGAGTAAGSFGQLLYAPLTVSLIEAWDGRRRSVIFAPSC